MLRLRAWTSFLFLGLGVVGQLTGWEHGDWAENEKVNQSTAELGVREGFHSYPEYET